MWGGAPKRKKLETEQDYALVKNRPEHPQRKMKEGSEKCTVV